MSKQVVAIDCDAVLTDNAAVWDRYIAENRCGGNHPVVYDPTDWDRYQKLCPTCFKACLTDPAILYTCQVREEVYEALPILASTFDLWVVTNRPEGTFDVTRNWLSWTGISKYLVGMTYASDKRTVCESIGAIALLDDGPANILGLQGSSVHPIIYDFPYNSPSVIGFNVEGTRVRDWFEATKAIFEVATGLVPTAIVA